MDAAQHGDHLVRVVACLNPAGETRLHVNRHRLHKTLDRTFEIALDTGVGDSPRWRLCRRLVNGACLDTVTLYAHPHKPSLWEGEFFQREGVDRLPVEGRYLVGVSAWCTPDQVATQESRLQEILKEWLAYQAIFFRDATDRLAATLHTKKAAAKPKAYEGSAKASASRRGKDNPSPAAKGVDISGERLRRPL